MIGTYVKTDDHAANTRCAREYHVVRKHERVDTSLKSPAPRNVVYVIANASVCPSLRLTSLTVQAMRILKPFLKLIALLRVEH